MASQIVDDKAMVVDVFNGKAKGNGNPFTIAKILFSGTGTISSVFVEQGSPALPPVNTQFAVTVTPQIRQVRWS